VRVLLTGLAILLAVPLPAAGDGIMLVQAGAFWMGRDDGPADEAPLHRVYVRDFWIERHKVTNAEFAAFLNARGVASAEGERRYDAEDGDARIRLVPAAEPHAGWVAARGHERHPVVEVSWFGARDYCAWRGRRLPTEAEWEKAARGGTEGQRFPWGNDIDPTRGNYLADPGAKRERGTRPCGTYAANAYGLCDMGGNVWEWVSDWYAPDYYAAAASRNPRGPAGGAMRVVRGGSWVNADVGALRCACRHPVPPDTYAYSIGFRIVCEP
jgi:formylglycine-generating enzyme required for sulfatase activity